MRVTSNHKMTLKKGKFYDIYGYRLTGPKFHFNTGCPATVFTYIQHVSVPELELELEQVEPW